MYVNARYPNSFLDTHGNELGKELKTGETTPLYGLQVRA